MSKGFNGPVGVHRFHNGQCLRVAKGTLPYQVSGVGMSLSELSEHSVTEAFTGNYSGTALFLICAWSTAAVLGCFMCQATDCSLCSQ
ncbi:hypothetical protein DER45DRAFT_608746 [Fusarium avenaceum]|nr:hypothetical protein DER45DRAFT_608746 [Fusarium avenaceum]